VFRKKQRYGGLPYVSYLFVSFFFHELRKTTYKQAEGLYGSQEEEDDGVVAPDERTHQEKLKDLTDFYYNTYMILSKDDPLKIDDVLNLSLQEALTYLLYKINKWKREKEEIEKSRKKNRK